MNAEPLPIPTRLRPDLEWSPYQSDRSDLWIAHDPIHREFYFFSAVEKAIAVCLDGRTSVQRIVKNAKRIDDSVCETFVRNLIGRLDRASLLLDCKWRQTDKRVPNTVRWLSRASSWMAWRVPLLNPSKAIGMLGPVAKLAFGPTVLSLGVGAVLFCLLLLANRWSEFAADLAVLQAGMRGDRVLFAGLLLLAIKATHEIGHALASHSVGAECREMGLFFFFLAPCMYCDVSDSWRVPSRWKRMLVSAAGMITEIAITLIAFVIWYSSDITWVRGTAVQVMLLCSVVTVLVNANPLMRYDGYYILSDALRIPNLADQARESWSQLWRNGLFEMSIIGPIPRGLLLAIYHIASTIYRWFLLSILIWGVNSWMLQQRLGGFAAILSTVFGVAVLANVWLSIRSSRVQNESPQPIRWFRCAFWLLVFSLLAWMIGTWQFPKHLFARGVLEPGFQVAMYARHSGLVSQVAVDGSSVREGATIMIIESPELELQRIQAVGDLNIAMVRTRQAASRSVDDPLAARQLAELEKTEAAMRKRVEKIADEVSQLQIRSQVGGVFVDAISEQTKSDISGRSIGQCVRLGQLAIDRPFIERGMPVGDIVSLQSWRLRTYVNELDVDACKVGANTLVRLDQLPGLTLRGRVVSIAEDRVERTPSKLQGDTLFASTLADARSNSKPEQTTYSLIIDFDVQDCKPIANGLASVQIEAGASTMFSRWLQILRRSWSIEPLRSN